MINENEIRIGNWFHHTQQWSTMQGHDTLDFFDFKWTSSNWYQIGECLLSLEVLEPITLNEDWLLKFGFENRGNEFIKNDFVIRKQQKDLIIHGYSHDYNGILLGKPEYVHQLQNLYFALVGEELVLQD